MPPVDQTKLLRPACAAGLLRAGLARAARYAVATKPAKLATAHGPLSAWLNSLMVRNFTLCNCLNFELK